MPIAVLARMKRGLVPPGLEARFTPAAAAAPIAVLALRERGLVPAAPEARFDRPIAVKIGLVPLGPEARLRFDRRVCGLTPFATVPRRVPAVLLPRKSRGLRCSASLSERGPWSYMLNTRGGRIKCIFSLFYEYKTLNMHISMS